MKQTVSRLFLSSLLLAAPGAAVQASCSTGSCGTTNSCGTGCNTGCSTDCGDVWYSCKQDCGNTSDCGSCGTTTNSCGTDCASTSCSSGCGATPSVFIPRSQGSNTVLLFAHPWAHRYDVGQFYGGFYMDFEYQRSFNADNLACCLFGTNALQFQGSQVSARNSSALIADYFGLATNFSGTMSIKPVIQNYILHWSAYFGFDEWAPGLYLKLDMTFANQNRSLVQDCSCDTAVTSSGSTTFPAGYMTSGTASTINNISTALDGQTNFGDKTLNWRYARFAACSQSKSALAAFDVNLGYDFLRCEDYFLGLFFRFTAPTGNRPDADYVFSPVVGNGHHWEVGGGLSSAWKFWECDDEQSLSFLLDGYVVTELSDTQLRTFDLAYSNTSVCSSLSRYVLLKQLTNGTTYAGGSGNASGLVTAASYTTRQAKVAIGVKGDMTIRMEYVNGNFDLAFGYNLYGQSKESISCISAPLSCDGLGSYSWGVKGCEGLYSFAYTTTAGGLNSALVFSATRVDSNTQSNANAYDCGTVDNPVGIVGGNPVPPVSGVSGGFIQVNWDSSAVVNGTTLYGASLTNVPYNVADGAGVDLAYTSTPVVIAQDCTGINPASGESPRQLTNKGFVYFNYLWRDCDWTPFLGIGGEVEGGSRNCDLAQWGVFIRGGVSY